MKLFSRFLLILFITLFLYTGIAYVKPATNLTPTHTPFLPTGTEKATSTHTPIPPTATSTSTATSTPSNTPTLTNTPTSTSSPTPSPTKLPSLTPSQTQTATPTTPYGYIPENVIVFYLTHLETGGPVACGDSLVAILTGFNRTGNIEKDVQLAVDTLFSVGQYRGGLYNATYPSNLRVSSLNINNGEAIVDLDGFYEKPKDACDASRYRAQVWATIKQFPEISRAIPKVRDKLLGDLLAVYSDGRK